MIYYVVSSSAMLYTTAVLHIIVPIVSGAHSEEQRCRGTQVLRIDLSGIRNTALLCTVYLYVKFTPTL